MADSIDKNSGHDLAWYREDGKHPVVVTLLHINLSLPDRNDNTSSPVGRNDPRVPNGTQQSVQPQKGGGTPRLEHLSVDAAPSRSSRPVTLSLKFIIVVNVLSTSTIFSIEFDCSGTYVRTDG